MAERLLVQPSIPQDKLAQALPFQLKTSILVDARCHGAILAIALGWNVRPRSPFGDKRPDPIRIVAAICQQPRATRELLQQDRAEPIVMRLTPSEANHCHPQRHGSC